MFAQCLVRSAAAWRGVAVHSRPVSSPRPMLRLPQIAPCAYYSGGSAPAQEPSQPPASELRKVASYTVYKANSALNATFIPPTWATRGAVQYVDREGVVLLEFAKANEGSGTMTPGATNRTYNWQNKVTWALSVNEVGSLLAPRDPSAEVTLWHDPTKLGKQEAKKKLIFKRLAEGYSLVVFQGPANVSVSVTAGEMEVLQAMFRYALPRLLGLDAVLP